MDAAAHETTVHRSAPARDEPGRASVDTIVEDDAPLSPSIRMEWASLLFMHWRIDASLLRPLVPAALDIDTYDGAAWIGVVPFTMPSIGSTRLPRLFDKRRVHEINVRTYVTSGEERGVWFFSLDCASPMAVRLARWGFHLPYYHADIELRRADRTIRYNSRRRHRGAAPALFDATWFIGDELPRSEPGDLPYFLTERYSLFTEHRGELFRGRIQHEPWPLREAFLEREQWRSSMIEALGIPEPREAPHLLFSDHLAPITAWRLETL